MRNVILFASLVVLGACTSSNTEDNSQSDSTKVVSDSTASDSTSK